MASKTLSNTEQFDKFIAIYNQLDYYMRRQPGVDQHTDHGYAIQQMIAKNRLFARHEQELRNLAALRNVLIHNPFMRTIHPIAIPITAIIDRYQQLLDLLINPPLALSIAVPAAMIYTTTLDSNALEVMKTMNKKTFTHIPVMDNDKMIGVFSENTLLSYLAHHGDSIVTKDLTIAEFSDFIGLDKHPGEQFEFIGRKAQLADVYAIFNQAIKVRKRIGVVFVTEHGKSNEKLLGLITAWDLASPELTL